MSIISLFPSDHSDLLCRRYATAVSHYFEDPSAAKESVAQVPLENLFRVLEMYRYDAFSDEHRRGVLALESRDESHDLRHESHWHIPIQEALEKAMTEVFIGVAKETAVPELQASLRQFVTGEAVPPSSSEKCRTFFVKFSESLAAQTR